MADIEPRVALLETGIGEIKVTVARIEERLNATATSIQVAELRADLGGQIAEIRGQIKNLPSTWVMLIGIIGGQVALAALIGSVVFGMTRMLGKA